jgi:hypothetical protein
VSEFCVPAPACSPTSSGYRIEHVFDKAFLRGRAADLGARVVRDVRALGEGEVSVPARCFLDRHLAELDAVYATTGPTTEGDPITTVFVTGRGGRVATFIDTTRVAFGAGERVRQDARRAVAPTPTGTVDIVVVDSDDADLDAPLPEAVGDGPPEWFVDRQPLRWCGMDVRVEDRAVDARRCLWDAVADGDPAEYAVGQTGDEGERAIRWFRVLGPGSVEVIERDLSGAPPTDQVVPTWRRLRCARIDVISDPGGAGDGLPVIEDPTTCTD